MIRVNPIDLRVGYRFPEFEKQSTGSRIYLHGEAEYLNGFDCCGILEDTFPTEEGVYPCEILGVEHRATLFLWKDLSNYRINFEDPEDKEYYLNGPGKFQGLIALNKDERSFKDAYQKFKQRTTHF